MSARSTGEKDRDAALIVVSGWLRDGLPGKDGERRKAEAAFDLDGILRGIRKAELDSGGALAIVKAINERGLIEIGAVPAGKGSVDFVNFLSDFFDYDKSAYVKDRMAHGHSIGRRYCNESRKLIRLFWEPAFKGRTMASITRNDLKAFSLCLPADKSASCRGCCKTPVLQQQPFKNVCFVRLCLRNCKRTKGSQAVVKVTDFCNRLFI
jgi:hypothetical protein